jgi:hypothetical protein
MFWMTNVFRIIMSESNWQLVPEEQLKSLHSFIARQPPFCSGTLPVTQNDLVLYYGKDELAW